MLRQVLSWSTQWEHLTLGSGQGGFLEEGNEHIPHILHWRSREKSQGN